MQFKMRIYALLILLVIIPFHPIFAQEIWTIGQPDNDYKELAIAGRYENYRRTFRRDVAFTIGKNDASKDWSFIHPGPADFWAASREHPFIIKFNMPDAPTGQYELRIDFVDVQGAIPPRFSVEINGTKGSFMLAKGAGDASLRNPKAGREQIISIPLDASLLRKGENAITFRCVGGSWALYDCVSLSSRPAEKLEPTIKRIQAKPTVFFVKENGRVKQQVDLVIEGIAAARPAVLTVKTPQEQFDVQLKSVPFGDLTHQIGITPVERPTRVSFALKSDGKSFRSEVTVRPQKKWRIYVSPSVHTDIGYTGLQGSVIERHNRDTDLAVEYCQKYPTYKWNLESSWAAQNYLKLRPKKQSDGLLELARQRRISIEALYLNMLTGLCSGEELNRSLYFSYMLHRRYGAPFESATLTDAPSHVWSIPMVLSRAGIKGLSMGINQTRAPILSFGGLHLKSPVYWQGPDGSKVLAWFSPGYARAGVVGLRGGVEKVRSAVSRFVAQWESRKDYPYDAVLLHGAYGDNALINDQIPKTAQAWSELYEYPKIILCSNADFFKYIEENFADKIPTVSGCGGSWWEDGAASSAKETALNRRNHEGVVTAEKLWTIASIIDKRAKYPQLRFNAIWDNILLYDEHTWGAAGSISHPESKQTIEQWRVKASYAHKAAAEIAKLTKQGLNKLAVRIRPTGPALVVFNPLSWRRTDVVRVELPERWSVYDSKDRPVATQTTAHEKSSKRGKTLEVAFLAEDCPPLGYKCYRLAAPTKKEAAKRKEQTQTLENKFYRLTFDAKTGGVKSILDKTLNRELVDTDSPYTLNQYIYAAGGENSRALNFDTRLPLPKYKLFSPTEAAIVPGADGPVLRSVIVQTSAEMTPKIESEIILYERVKRIDIINRLTKTQTYKKEAVYFAFPFNFTKPQFKYEIGNGAVRPNKDQLPGACKDWLSAQNWVTVADNEAAVVWSSPDTPLVCLCGINPGKWLEELPIANGTIFSYAMNNYWFTNYKAGQGGDFEFRYAISSGAKVDDLAATRLGWGVAAPLSAVISSGVKEGALPNTGESFFDVDKPNVVISTVKQAEDGRGYIIRLFETTGRDTTASLRFGLLDFNQAALCSLVEEDKKPLTVRDKTVGVSIAGHGIETVRVW